MHFRVEFNQDELKQIIREAVGEAMAKQDGSRSSADGPIAIKGDFEAGRLLGFSKTQMRDLRLSGKISYSRGPKGVPVYRLKDLEDYLDANREGV